MPQPIRITVDVMSGDNDPRFVIRACASFCRNHSDAQLTLVGDQNLIQAEILPTHPNINIVHTSGVVTMEDKPGLALRHKRDASMSIAVKMHAEKKTDACWSGGNTGALMAFGLHWLSTLEGVERPAICKAIPTKNHIKSFLLDVGANTHCTPKQLQQFAELGNALAKRSGVAEPKITLLNVGAEEHKGGQLQQEAETLIRANKALNYRGFIEGDALFDGSSHVIVCDGFSGNVILKACEGTAEFMLSGLEQAVEQNWFTRLLGSLMNKLFRHWRESYNPDDLNGAVFLGLNGIVVKSHGNTSQRGLLASLQVAYDQALHRNTST